MQEPLQARQHARPVVVDELGVEPAEVGEAEALLLSVDVPGMEVADDGPAARQVGAEAAPDERESLYARFAAVAPGASS